MRHLTLFLALSVFCSLLAAATFDESIGINLPDEIAGLPFKDRKVFPQKELGVNYAWQSADLRGSLYVYTGGEKNIPAGHDNEVVQRHFAKVLEEAKAMEKLGKVRAVIMPSGMKQTTKYPGCGPQFVWSAFEMDMVGQVIASSTYLTAINGNFVKLRVHYPKGDEQGHKTALLFVEKIRKVLGKCTD